ncbi:hypothetical protein [Exiguobacterium sp. s161]|uniref:hypothetical protein n=1 Tax=Exiguobacterium sp. s161 TaxID=2751191 RepID=UPI001BE80E50|nr:hypothetical protein [Exiguobacterium sp. s161]
MLEKIKQISQLFNDQEKLRWYGLEPELNKILGTRTLEELISDLEESLETFPRKKLPHYCLVFFLAIFILNDYKQSDNIIADIKSKKCYKNLINGLKIFLVSKSADLRYEIAESNYDDYKNKYEYVESFSSYVYTFEIKNSAFLNILNFIYLVEPKDFYNIIVHDKQNILFLCFFTRGRQMFKYEDLIQLLLIDDEVKSNSVFFHLMLEWRSLVRKYYSENVPAKRDDLSKEIERINLVFSKVPIERRTHFIINFLFVKNNKINEYPICFVEDLQNIDINILIFEIKKLDLSNLFVLIKIFEVMKLLSSQELEKVFTQYFLKWIDTNSNHYVWEQNKKEIYKILHLITPKAKKNISSELTLLKNKLFISSFDRQVRYTIFYKDEIKGKIIAELLAIKDIN